MTDIDLFYKLRFEVAATFLKENSASSVNFIEWKGRDIVNFQDSLLEKVKTQVSEKWFYTYFKNETLSKIPRIDMLNILSEYAGYSYWNNFKAEKSKLSALLKNENLDNTNEKSFLNERDLTVEESLIKLNETKKIAEILTQKKSSSLFVNDIKTFESEDKSSRLKKILKKKSYLKILSVFLLLIGFLVGFLFWIEVLPLKYSYEFYFIDSDRNSAVNSNLEFTLLQKDESPIHFKGDKSGYLKIRLKENNIKLIVTSPYYKTDTIVRLVNSKYHVEKVLLNTDDYALMLHYLTNSKVEDWKRRRKELNKLISNKAIIYQVYGKEFYGIDILTKEEFINKLTLPTSTLKNLNIIETKKQNNKITKLKFEVTPNEN